MILFDRLFNIDLVIRCSIIFITQFERSMVISFSLFRVRFIERINFFRLKNKFF